MRNIISLITLLLLTSGLHVVAQDQTVVIKSTAQCSECKEKIENALLFEKGVKSAKVDVGTQNVTVVYNPAKTTPEKIRLAISKSGYDADSIPADPKAYAKLKPCCTKEGHKEH